jgi:hypothetical protein
MSELVREPSRRLGRKPTPHELLRRSLPLTRYLPEALPAAPDSVTYSKHVRRWPMYLNDRLGDCLVEGTEVSVPGAVLGGYRGLYSGPVVRLRTAGGHRLAVTPNHPILTPSGFVAACSLREGDRVLSSPRPDEASARLNPELEQRPARIEDVVAALRRRRMTFGGSRYEVPTADDFHGDGLFMQGNVEVVGAAGRLEVNAQAVALEQEGQEERVATRGGRPERMSGYGSAGEGLGRIARPSATLVHRPQSAPTFFGWDASPVDPLGFGARPKLHASARQNRLQPTAMDPQLAQELREALPGLITADDVVDVELLPRWTGHVYDLNVERHWYIAGGIVAHNCTCAAAAHMLEVWNKQVEHRLNKPTEQQVVDLYGKVNGGVDQGASMQEVLNVWRREGLGGQRILAYVSMGPKRRDLVTLATWLFSGLYIGLNLPKTARQQRIWDVVPDGGADARPGSWGGHCVSVVDYNAAGVVVVTWGALMRVTWAFFDAYCDEAYAVLPAIYDKLGGKPLENGFDEERLRADLAQLASA